MVSIDGDTSPNDSLLIMANGKAGNNPITAGSRQADVFQQALDQVCINLARCIAKDAEGATKLIEVNVSGAANVTEARLAARTIVSSPLVKTAVYGNDPNWGRVIAALARSGVEIEEEKIDLSIGNHCILKAGSKVSYNEEDIIKELKNAEVNIKISLNLGTDDATAWGCDLTEEYVVINSKYTT
jgi:glutamate N-acetyltransferase/amino-acid N-acetyltransferase